MSNKTKRFILPEDEIPRYWYNIQADMVNKPMPPLNPATKQPLKAEDLYPIFAQELCRQELNQTDALKSPLVMSHYICLSCCIFPLICKFSCFFLQLLISYSSSLSCCFHLR